VTGTIELDRVRLEPLGEDLARAIVSDESRGDFADGFPTSGERRVAAWLLRPEQPEPCHPFCVYLIRERGGELLIGSAGFHGAPEHRVAEIGYGLVPSRWGRGLAGEAVMGLLDAARSSGEVDRVRATVDERNRASMAVLRRCGFTSSPGIPSAWSIDLA
jgi:RimJ/RimL family protein N-acetyltransferase